MSIKSIEERRRELREAYNSDKFWPLTKDESDRFHQAAVDAAEPKTRFVGLTLLYTGMRNGELCHMRQNWFTVDATGEETMLEVDIPSAEVCTGSTGPTSKDESEDSHVRHRDEVCYQCRDQDRDHWSPKTGNGDRLVTIKEQDAVKTIKWWFNQHEEVPMMHNAVNRRLKRLTNQADIKRKVTAHDLRDTYATMLVRKGFNAHPIKRIMGHNDPERLEDYFKFVGKHQQQEFKEKW
jgi:integrase